MSVQRKAAGLVRSNRMKVKYKYPFLWYCLSVLMDLMSTWMSPVTRHNRFHSVTKRKKIEYIFKHKTLSTTCATIVAMHLLTLKSHQVTFRVSVIRHHNELISVPRDTWVPRDQEKTRDDKQNVTFTSFCHRLHAICIVTHAQWACRVWKMVDSLASDRC